MREPLINKILVIRLTLLAMLVGAVALLVPYPQNRIEVVDPQVNAPHLHETDSNS